MSKKIISAGHICIDITPVFPRVGEYAHVEELLIPGKLLNMDPVEVHTGGSVANTGLALKVLGADVRLMGKVGDDAFGAMIREILAGYGAGGLIVDKNCATSYTVALAIPGIDRILLHCPGANDTFTKDDIPEDGLEDAALFHFGYPPIMKVFYENDGTELVALLRRVKEKNIATSMDMSAVDPTSPAGQVNWEKILENALPYTDIFVPSFEELCFMLNRPRYDALCARGGDMVEGLDMENDVKPLADRCLELGCRAVLVKCGTSGMYFKTAHRDAMMAVGSRLELDIDAWASKEGIQPCFKADQVLSGTGAGDTSIAAFLLAAVEGKTPAQCAALAAAEGACSVTAYDALSGLKPLHELEARIAAGWETM